MPLTMIEELTAIVSKEQIVSLKEKTIYGNEGKIVVFPKTEEEIANILRYANDRDKTVNVEGMGTKRGFGGTISEADILLSLKDYYGIVEHTVGDMTMTVKAGTPFQEIQSYLRAHNQMIPLDPSYREEATIGGIIAANDSGPKRLGYGSARDLVIGLRVAYPNGQVIRTGGKVVKNVAGYDMNKLFIGSMGTLGVITEITLKLRPLPKYESVVFVSLPREESERLKQFTVQLLDSYMEPKALELLSPALSDRLLGRRALTLAIAFEDVKRAVLYQEDYVKRNKPERSELEIRGEEEATKFWHSLGALSPSPKVQQDFIAVLKVGVKNLDVFQVIKECQLFEETGLQVVAHGGVGHGLCTVYVKGSEAEIVSFVASLREAVKALGGYVVAKHLPLSLRKRIDVWGEKPAHFFLFEGIKTKIDPKRLLNRSRFVGGI